jgi:hypothetical protein
VSFLSRRLADHARNFATATAFIRRQLFSQRGVLLRKFTVLIALLALLAVPAFASGHARHQAHGAGVGPAAAACKSERKADPAAFKTKYANKKGKRAFQRCVAAHVRQAAKTCRAERKADPAAFKTKYANKKGKHAFRRCVRQHEADPVA